MQIINNYEMACVQIAAAIIKHGGYSKEQIAKKAIEQVNEILKQVNETEVLFRASLPVFPVSNSEIPAHMP